jgi:hypothetical protein
MTIMLGKIYAALKAAGAPDDEARAAAEEVGGLHDLFGGLRNAVQLASTSRLWRPRQGGAMRHKKRLMHWRPVPDWLRVSRKVHRRGFT